MIHQYRRSRTERRWTEPAGSRRRQRGPTAHGPDEYDHKRMLRFYLEPVSATIVLPIGRGVFSCFRFPFLCLLFAFKI